MTRPDADQVGRLQAFREAFYDTLESWGDALFELTDALVSSPVAVGSVPALSPEAVFRRSHGSLYKALARGGIDAEAMRDALVASRRTDWPLVFAVDASTWERPDAETSPERGMHYHPSRHSAGKPVVAGWSYQWMSQLDWAPDSWTQPLDARRIAPGEDATAVTVGQVRGLVRRLGETEAVPMFVFDAGYSATGLSVGLSDVQAQVEVCLSL